MEAAGDRTCRNLSVHFWTRLFLPPFEPAAVRRVAHGLIAHRFRSPPPLIFFDFAPFARPRFMDHPFVRRRRDHFAIRAVTADHWIGSRDFVAILPDPAGINLKCSSE
jgi:hypothetical protein